MAAIQFQRFQAFSLTSRLSSLPASSEDKKAVTLALWAPDLSVQDYAATTPSYQAYMQHIYCDLCRIASTSSNQVLASFTHQQLLDICSHLRRQRSTLGTALTALGPYTAENERLIRIAASLLLPLNINGTGGVRPGKLVDWERDQPLADLALSNFQPAGPPPHPPHSTCTLCGPSAVQVHLPTNFNAFNLEYLAGFEIIWTSILTDHLKVLEVDDKVKVYLFHQTGLLQRHLALQDPIIPHEVISETFETLALLIPRRNHNLQQWFNKLQKKHNLDPGAGACTHLPTEYRVIGHFNYWRERLRDLKEVFDSREPPGPVYVWRDRSKPVQWWTFWVAVLVLVLTLLFGLIQSITGILQVTGLRGHS